jgi:ribose transport system substrate-binding protein
MHYRIGFANLSEELPFSIDVRRGLERAAKGMDDLDFVYVDNRLDGNEAIRVVDELISRDVNLVIEYQIDERAGHIIMKKLEQKQIPVIAVDIPMVGATYFGVDNFTAGYMAGIALGQWIKTHWNGHVDRIIVLEEKRAGALPTARIQGQLSGVYESLGELPESTLTFIGSGNTARTSYDNVLPILNSVPANHHLAFVCFNDDAAIGALYAVRDKGLESRSAIVGQGADRQIRDEIRAGSPSIIGSTAFMPEKYGEKLVSLALKLLNGAPVPPAVYMDHIFIDRSNIMEYYAD